MTIYNLPLTQPDVSAQMPLFVISSIASEVSAAYSQLSASAYVLCLFASLGVEGLLSLYTNIKMMTFLIFINVGYPLNVLEVIQPAPFQSFSQIPNLTTYLSQHIQKTDIFINYPNIYTNFVVNIGSFITLILLLLVLKLAVILLYCSVRTQSWSQKLIISINDKLIYRTLGMLYQIVSIEIGMTCSLQIRFMTFADSFNSLSTVVAYVGFMTTILLMSYNLRIQSQSKNNESSSEKARIYGFKLSLIDDTDLSTGEKPILIYDTIQKFCYSILIIALINYTVAQMALLTLVNIVVIFLVIKNRKNINYWQFHTLNVTLILMIFCGVLVFAINDSHKIMEEWQKVIVGFVVNILLACYLVFTIVSFIVMNSTTLKRCIKYSCRKILKR